jgi:hypothetical protein
MPRLGTIQQGGRVKRLALGAAGLLWLAALAAALSILLTYDNTPGAVAHAAPASWPAEAGLPRIPGQPTLVMLVHPKCPCSRASVGELAVLLAQASRSLTTHVLFYKPEGVSDDWHSTDLWRSAAAIPGVTPRIDEHGTEAKRFGVATSGHTLLYDADGRLQFTGGITASRGHAGDNAGRRAVLSLLREPSTETVRTSVFGCSLYETTADGVAPR